MIGDPPRRRLTFAITDISALRSTTTTADCTRAYNTHHAPRSTRTQMHVSCRTRVHHGLRVRMPIQRSGSRLRANPPFKKIALYLTLPVRKPRSGFRKREPAPNERTRGQVVLPGAQKKKEKEREFWRRTRSVSLSPGRLAEVESAEDCRDAEGRSSNGGGTAVFNTQERHTRDEERKRVGKRGEMVEQGGKREERRAKRRIGFESVPTPVLPGRFA